MIGMIFEWDNSYRVVESASFGLAQHNPYNWKVKNGEFVMADDIYDKTRLADKTINEWILSLEEQKIKIFVDTLYQVISASQADDLIAITADWKRSMNGVVSALKEVDEETAKVLREIIKALFDMTRARMKEELVKPKRKTKRVRPPA